jgi:hypothetical protein
MKLERKIKNFIQKCTYSLFHFLYPDKTKIPPKKIHESFWEYSKIHTDTLYKEVYPSNCFNRQLPQCLYNGLDSPFRDCQKIIARPDSILSLPNARVYGRDGLIITSDNSLIRENIIDGDFEFKEHPLNTRYKLPKELYIDGTVAIVASKWADCYYHWMLEVLPKFHLFSKSDLHIDYFIISKLEFPFQKESLELLGLDFSKLLFIDNETLYKAKNIIIASTPGEVGNPPKWALDYIRDNLKSDENSNKPEKIYISRKNARYRRIVNEQELIPILKQRGYEIIFPEKLSLREQINTFSKAKVIVAPHGAGQTNLAFTPDNIKLIELFSPDYINVCYWAISNEKNIKYSYLKGKEKLNDFDILVNIDELIKILEKVDP